MDDQSEPDLTSAKLESTISFAGFVLDLRGERILLGAEPVKLRRKCFQALRLLADSPGRVIPKEELLRRLWPDCVVGEDSLHQCIRELRKTLGCNGQQIIRTAPGRGYALAAAVSSCPSGTPRVLASPDTQTLPAVSSAGVSRGRSLSAWIYTPLAALVVLLLAGLALLPRPGPAHRIASLAVLPFAMPDGDSSYSYIGQSIAESVTASLSRHNKVRVLSFDSAWRLKGDKLNNQNAGRRLGVDAIVSGRVRPEGERLVVGVELVRVADDAQLWGKQYYLKVEDLSTLESEIAYDVSGQVGSGPTQTRRGAPTRPSPHPEAYVEVLRGRYEQRKRSPIGIRAALDHFQRAVEIDPSFAGAWADLADIRFNQFVVADSPRKNGSKMGMEAALRALEIDDTIGQAHAIIAAFRFIEDFDWNVAETEFRLALDLTPFAGSIYLRYSMMLVAMGRLSEALTVASRAQEVDPLSPVLHSWIANVQFVSGIYHEAIEEGRKSLALDGNFGLGHLVLGRSYVQLGQYRDGIMELNKAREELGGNWRPLGDLAYAYAVAGEREKARTLLNDMMDRRIRTSLPALPIVLAYTGLADRDQAFVWLRRAIEERGSELWLKTDPRLATLRPDPRFIPILSLMKLR
jgi:DNA-binding winged helix-turn-helix (wHTH) protein/TolB-like protein/tetratricopeptide (TPR) repeat protein